MDSHLYAPVPFPTTFPTPSELMLDLASFIPPPDFPPESARSTHATTFVPTDPDSISSHEKKRHYLECIEQYIQFLHEQFHLLGERPPEMERVASYRGMSSRSIRTLLVHMEHNTRKLTERTRHEEQRFVSVQNELQY